MNFDWKKLDLKNASIFDLTDDIELIRKCTCMRSITLNDKDEYLNNGGPLHYIPGDMDTFAIEVKDAELSAELRRIFAKEFKEIAALYNE